MGKSVYGGRIVEMARPIGLIRRRHVDSNFEHVSCVRLAGIGATLIRPIEFLTTLTPSGPQIGYRGACEFFNVDW